jgi:hypothetical protein
MLPLLLPLLPLLLLRLLLRVWHPHLQGQGLPGTRNHQRQL